MRSCGQCNACCILPSVKGLTEAFSPCKHLIGGCAGCQIYTERPAACEEFECLWRTQDSLPKEYRPDRCKVMISGYPGHDDRVVVWSVGGSWQKKKMEAVYRWIIAQGVEVWVREAESPEEVHRIVEDLDNGIQQGPERGRDFVKGRVEDYRTLVRVDAFRG